jgi:hypothetical protein
LPAFCWKKIGQKRKNFCDSSQLQLGRQGSILKKTGCAHGAKERVMKKKLVIMVIGLLVFQGASWADQTLQTPQTPDRPLGSEFAKGVLSPVLSIPYFPVKLAVGIVGAVLGGVSGWATGGSERAAQGIWRPMVGGTYFITPQIIEGERPFLPFDGGVYAQPPQYTAPPKSLYQQP